MSKSLDTNNRKNGSGFASIIIVIFYMLYLIKIKYGSFYYISSVTSIFMIIIGISSLLLIILFEKIPKKVTVISLLFAYILFSFLSSLYTENYRFQDYFLLLQYMGVGLLLIKFRLNNKIIRTSFYIHTLFFVLLILLGTHPNDVFTVSRNNISSIMIIQCSLLYMSDKQMDNKIKILPSIILFIISIWAIGRSGIISAIVLLVGIILINQNSSKHKFFKAFSLTIFLSSFYLVAINFLYDSIFKNAVERESNQTLLDPARTMIIEEYLKKASESFYNLILGFHIKDNFVFSIFSYNLHNAYLRLHSLSGLGGVLIFIILIVRAAFMYFKDKNYILLLLLVVIILRMSTDILAFHGPFDPLIYYLTLNNFTGKKNTYNHHLKRGELK